VKAEVKRLLSVGMIREVAYPKGLPAQLW
jgi:hypothetical protein